LRFIQILPIARPIKQKTPISCMKSAFIVEGSGKMSDLIKDLQAIIDAKDMINREC